MYNIYYIYVLIYYLIYYYMQGWNDLNQLIKISDLNHKFD